MMLKSALAGLLLLAAGTAIAADADQPDANRPRDASIPFANMGSIRNFDAVNDHTIYIEDVHGQWYRATTMGPCIDLPFANAVGFDVRGTGTLDKFSSVIVKDRRCAFESLVESAPPPGARPRNRRKS
jgi:hypothetical protein